MVPVSDELGKAATERLATSPFVVGKSRQDRVRTNAAALESAVAKRANKKKANKREDRTSRVMLTDTVTAVSERKSVRPRSKGTGRVATITAAATCSITAPTERVSTPARCGDSPEYDKHPTSGTGKHEACGHRGGGHAKGRGVKRGRAHSEYIMGFGEHAHACVGTTHGLTAGAGNSTLESENHESGDKDVAVCACVLEKISLAWITARVVAAKRASLLTTLT